MKTNKYHWFFLGLIFIGVAAVTPIQKLLLQGDADGGGHSFTNLVDVAVTGHFRGDGSLITGIGGGAYNGNDATNNDKLFGAAATNNDNLIGLNATNNDKLFGAAATNNDFLTGAAATNNDHLFGTAATNNDHLFGQAATNNDLVVGALITNHIDFNSGIAYLGGTNLFGGTNNFTGTVIITNSLTATNLHNPGIITWTNDGQGSTMTYNASLNRLSLTKASDSWGFSPTLVNGGSLAVLQLDSSGVPNGRMQFDTSGNMGLGVLGTLGGTHNLYTIGAVVATNGFTGGSSAFDFVWTGPTNQVLVSQATNYLTYVAITNTVITNIIGAIANRIVWTDVEISNSLAIPLTNWFTGVGTAFGGSTTNPVIVPGGKKMLWEFWTVGLQETNYLNVQSQ